MPEVILIDPDSGMANTRPQLGTLHLAAMLLQAGASVEILDLSVDESGLDKLRDMLGPDVLFVGISTVIGPMLRSGIEACQIVRDFSPTIPLIWGGVHPTIEPETTLCHDMVDAIALGEGEESVVEIYQALKTGKDLYTIHGMGFMKNGEPFYTPRRSEYFDISTLPPLPYHLIDLNLFGRQVDQADFFGLKGEQLMSIESTRGCAYRCTYCVNSAKKDKFRRMSKDKVISSIEDIVALGVRSITFNDDNFFVHKDWAQSVLEEIVARDWGLEIFIAVRSDFLAEVEDEFLALMKKAGIVMLGLGVESGSDRFLKHICKKEKIASTFKASQRLNKFGINAWYHFIYGFPGETKEDLIATYKAMYYISKTNPHARVNLNQLIPNPGTPSFFECLDGGWLAPTTLEKWADVMIHTRRMGRPPYMDEDLHAWWKDHLEGLSFPRADMPYVEDAWTPQEWKTVEQGNPPVCPVTAL